MEAMTPGATGKLATARFCRCRCLLVRVTAITAARAARTKEREGSISAVVARSATEAAFSLHSPESMVNSGGVRWVEPHLPLSSSNKRQGQRVGCKARPSSSLASLKRRRWREAPAEVFVPNGETEQRSGSPSSSRSSSSTRNRAGEGSGGAQRNSLLRSQRMCMAAFLDSLASQRLNQARQWRLCDEVPVASHTLLPRRATGNQRRRRSNFLCSAVMTLGTMLKDVRPELLDWFSAWSTATS
nr:hypothetical protein Iba_chr09fCG13670 [Ipomoea batatas]